MELGSGSWNTVYTRMQAVGVWQMMNRMTTAISMTVIRISCRDEDGDEEFSVFWYGLSVWARWKGIIIRTI